MKNFIKETNQRLQYPLHHLHGFQRNHTIYMDHMRLTACNTSTLDDDVWYHSNSDSKRLLVDRLSSLPDELLIRILSLLPTKDAAVTCFLSKRLRRVFSLITSLDIDDSPISHCSEYPYRIQQFPSFVTFVDTLLQAHRSQYLTRFRLGVGSDVLTRYKIIYQCQKHCLPDVRSARLGSWISFLLTCRGLRELDLRIHVREPSQLPLEIFTCETLEVLKLDVNLNLPAVDHLTSFRLPNLKMLHLRMSRIYEDGEFVTRLVSSCPLLEEFTVHAMLIHVQSIIINSPSLRRLHLRISTHDADNTDFLLIHTPNLEHLYFSSNLALQHSITNMDRLLKADINIGYTLINDVREVSYQQLLSFIRSLTTVYHLSLLSSCTRDLNLDVVKDQLPMFRNLKYLELGSNGYAYWDKVLVAFLKCSPVLETLVFPQGMARAGVDEIEENLQLEQEFCRTELAVIPWCCRFHLKRIVIKRCHGNKRDIDLIQFFLKHALVLEELVIYRPRNHYSNVRIANQMELHSALQSLPRASITSSIQVH